MDWYREFCDSRYSNMCAYCGKHANTKDHVPSKILLDKPYTENLPVVPCCNDCNHSFSIDEEYLACAVECSVHMTTDLSRLSRTKVIKALERNLQLKELLFKSIVKQTDLWGNDVTCFHFDKARLLNVISKLVRGHARYEQGIPFLNEPQIVLFKKKSEMTNEEITEFNTAPPSNFISEIGSRSSNFIASNLGGIHSCNLSMWEFVQADYYHYLVHHNDRKRETEVRILLAEIYCIQAILHN